MGQEDAKWREGVGMAATGIDRDTFGMVGAGLAVLGLIIALLTLLLTASGAVGTWIFGIAVLGLIAAAVALILAAHSITSRRKIDALLALVCVAALFVFGIFGYTFFGLSRAAATQQGRTAADTAVSVVRPAPAPDEGAGLPLTGDDSAEPPLPDTGEKVQLAETGRRLGLTDRRTGSQAQPFRPGTVLRQGGWEIVVGSPGIRTIEQPSGHTRAVPVTLTRTAAELGSAADIAIAALSVGGYQVLEVRGSGDLSSGQTSVVEVPLPESTAGLLRLEIGTSAPVYFELLDY